MNIRKEFGISVFDVVYFLRQLFNVEFLLTMWLIEQLDELFFNLNDSGLKILLSRYVKQILCK